MAILICGGERCLLVCQLHSLEIQLSLRCFVFWGMKIEMWVGGEEGDQNMSFRAGVIRWYLSFLVLGFLSSCCLSVSGSVCRGCVQFSLCTWIGFRWRLPTMGVRFCL